MNYAVPDARFLLAAGLLLTIVTLRAGPGHDHGPAIGAAGPSGPVTLSESQRRNLGLEVFEAGIVEMSPSVEVPAILVVPPERHGRVTASFAGRVVEVFVKLGQDVKKGDPIVEVAPLAVGSPPQTLTAPVSGHVIRQESSPGKTFTPETSLVDIADDSELLAQGLFFQSPMLEKIELGAPAEFLVDVFPGTPFEGTIQRVDPGHGPDEPSFHLYAELPNEQHALRPNLRGRLVVAIGEPQPVVAVPRRAVLGSLGNLFVFVENEDGIFERREVVTGLRSGNLVEVIEGVLPGDKVVTVGNYQLQFVTPEGDAAESSGGHGHSH